MKLVFVNEVGPDFRGNNAYEFIFSDSLDVYGDNWDSSPASGYPVAPNIEFIKKVLKVSHPDIDLVLCQDSDYFDMFDCVDGVIALAWENAESEFITNLNFNRLVFNYGIELDKVKDMFYERDIILKEEEIQNIL